MSNTVRQEAVKSKKGSIEKLRDPGTIRSCAHRMLEMAEEGKLKHFTLDMFKMELVAGYVASVIRANYPDLKIPYHSRWRHFEYGSADRWGALDKKMGNINKEEKVRRAIDLVVVSVLLDAGAGPDWVYREEDTSIKVGRSEGLGIASFHMFADGFFSSDKKNPYQVDVKGLGKLDEGRLKDGFQISEDNPMRGLEGRIQLVKALSSALETSGLKRPGDMYDILTKDKKEIYAADILAAILSYFSSIWPGRVEIDGQNMGDVWQYKNLEYKDVTSGYMPIHKLSQWLTYSLLEPFEEAGIKVKGLDSLTGLAEYRNGGLFIDSGVLVLKNPDDLEKEWRPDSDLIIEWRALTIALLDELHGAVAEALGLDMAEFPLAKLLEGGSWAAGRKLAYKRSITGESPVKILTDGTVF